MTRLETGKERKKNKASRRQGGAGFREGGGPPRGSCRHRGAERWSRGAASVTVASLRPGWQTGPPNTSPTRNLVKQAPPEPRGGSASLTRVSPAGRRGLHTVSHGDPRRTFQQETSANSAAKTRNAPPGASRFPPSPPWVPGQQVQKPRPGPRLAGAPRGEGPRVGGA